MIYETYHITNMISSGFRFLFFLVIFLAIYCCSASNNAPKNKETCKCGFPPIKRDDRKSVKSIVIKTSNVDFAGTENYPKITIYIGNPNSVTTTTMY